MSSATTNVETPVVANANGDAKSEKLKVVRVIIVGEPRVRDHSRITTWTVTFIGVSTAEQPPLARKVH